MNSNLTYFLTPEFSAVENSVSSFPNKFKGIYMSEDSLYLNITNDIIFSEREFKFRFHKNKIDSISQYFDIVNEKYISKEDKEVFDSKKIGDSIEFSSKYLDTIFKFSDLQKAKRINGYLVLNQRDSIYWKVKLISINKNKLTIRQLYSDDDLKRMDSITKVHSKMIDSTSFVITPKRREFVKFLELKDFGFNQEYKKM